MLIEILTDDLIALDQKAQTWEESVLKVGELLVGANCVEPRYVPAMVETIKELGPYAVLAPGVAMPHARAEDGVKKIGLALLRLEEPVDFGDQNNGHVDILFGLAALDHTSHLNLMRDLAIVLMNETAIDKIRNARTKEEIRQVIRVELNNK